MIKTEISLDLLHMGYDVIIVDLDIVFLQNPLPYLTCLDCDMVIQDNRAGYLNSGFYLIKPTKAGIELQKQSLEMAQKPGHTNDQDIMNHVANRLKKTHKLKIVLLPINQFQPGNIFFSNSTRNFAEDAVCVKCVIVHNNWIIGIRHKIYRFKEVLMWVVDTDGYYTSTENKYLTYSYETGVSKEEQKDALNLAFQIGKLLNRVVILPKFYCPNRKPSKRCHLLHIFGPGYMNSKPESTYRESVFLQHQKVPQSVKTSLSPEINTADIFIKGTIDLAKGISDGVLVNETLYNFKVLRFKSLILKKI